MNNEAKGRNIVPSKTTCLALFALLGSGCDGCGDDKSSAADVDAGANAEVTLTVLDESARACEVMLNERAWEVREIRFGETITGEWERWAPRVALAFTRGEDEALGTAVTLDLKRKAEGNPAEFESIQTTCYDRLGNAIEGAEVRVE